MENKYSSMSSSVYKKIPNLIQQENCVLSQQNNSLDSLFDEMMERIVTESPNSVIETVFRQFFSSTHAIVWIYLAHIDSYYSPSFSIIYKKGKGIISESFTRYSPIIISSQNTYPSFLKNSDDKVIPDNFSLLIIPIMFSDNNTAAVIEFARNPEKPFTNTDFSNACILFERLNIYSKYIFDDYSILAESSRFSKFSSPVSIFTQAIAYLEESFHCRKAELWLKKAKSPEFYQVCGEDSGIFYTSYIKPGCVEQVLLHNHSICSDSCSSIQSYNRYVDGPFNEPLLICPFSEKPKRTWCIVLRGRASPPLFTISDQSKLKYMIPFIIGLLQKAIRLKNHPITISGFQQRLSALLEVSEALNRNLNMNSLISTIMEKSCSLIGAERCSLFFVDSVKNELISHFQTGLQNAIRLPLDKGIVGTTVISGKTFRIDNAYQDYRFNRSIDELTGFVTKSLMTIPIYNTKGDIIGVTELINKGMDSVFTSEDEKLMVGFNVFCGIAIENAKLYDLSISLSHQIHSFLKMSDNLSSNTLMRNIIEGILQSSISISNSSGSSIHLLDPTESLTLLVALGDIKDFPSSFARKSVITKQTASYNGDEIKSMVALKSKKEEIKKPMKLGITKHTSFISQQHSAFKSMVDLPIQMYNPSTHLVCIPMFDTNGNVLGVFSLLFHQKVKSEDVKLLESFSVFASIALERNQLKDIASLGQKEMELKQWITKDERFQHTTIPAKLRLAPKELSGVWSLNFDSMKWDGIEGFQVVFAIFTRFGIKDTYQISNERLFRFLLELRESYKSVPYHNWRHAIDVTQYLTYLLITGRLDEKFSRFEIFCLIISSLCHDANHDGFSNTYNEKAETPLGILFKNQSVMEMHHCEVTIDIVSNDQCNLFAFFEPQYQKNLWSMVIQLILSTDMSKHFDYLKEFNGIVDSNTFSFDNPNHRLLFMQLLLKASDISNVARPFELANRWCDALCEEFFHQGDLEQTKGMQYTSPLNDREHLDKPKSQIGFYTYVCLPLFEAISKVAPILIPCVEQIHSNLEIWKRESENRL